MARNKLQRILWSASLLLLGGLLGFSVPAYAYHFPWDQGHDTFTPEPPDEEEPDDQCELTGSPFAAKSGAFFYETQDAMLRDLGAGVEIARSYNSQDRRSGPFGHGWTHTYDRRVIETTDGVDVFAVCRTGRGWRVRFALDAAAGTFTGPPNAPFSIARTASGWSADWKNGERQLFDQAGLLLSSSDRNGNAVTFTYDSGFLTTVTAPSGRQLAINKGANGKISSIVDWSGRVFSYSYDGNGNLVRYDDPAGGGETYQYDADHNLTSVFKIGDAGNAFLQATYDSLGRVATYTEGPERWTVEYLPGQSQSRKRDQIGNVWTLSYDDVGFITRIQDPLGGQETTTFGVNLRPLTVIDKLGRTTTYTYDERGNVLTQTDPLSNTWTHSYVAGTDWLEAITSPLGIVTKYVYDTKGNQIQVIGDFGGTLENTTTYRYDEDGNQIGVTDASGNTTTYGFDAQGNVTNVIDPLGNVISYTYDGRGNKLTETDPNGRTNTYTYDALDRVLAETDAQGGTTSFRYDLKGNLVEETDAQGNTIAQVYDTYNRLTQVTDALSNTTHYAYDSRGNLITLTDANGNSKTYAYDALNRLLSETNAVGEQANFSYDAVGNRLTITDGNVNTTTFAYDALNRVVRQTHPDGAQFTYGYDAVNNRISQTDPNGNTTTFAYDSLNRLLAKIYADGTTANFTYDSQGRLLTATDSDSTLVYTYDANGQLTQVIQSGRAINYTYDGVGNRTTMVTPNGDVVRYAYGVTDLLMSIQLPGGDGIGFSYDSLSRVIRKDYTSDSYSTFFYNPNGMPVQINHLKEDDSVVYAQENAYDNVGNILAKTTRLGQTAYTYDKDYRLITAVHPTTPPETFTYDAAGNRLTSADYGDWIYNNRNQLLAYDATSYTYDANGNPVSKADIFGVTQYSYDFENRLVGVVLPDGIRIAYEHDALGRRTRKNVAGNVTAYIYDDDALLAEYDASGVAGRSYFRTGFDTNPSLIKNTSGVFFVHHDHLETPQAVTGGGGGGVVWEATYAAFGQADVTAGAIQNNFRLPGQYFDAETGLHYNYLRVYDPSTGRYLESDPAGLEGGLNLYLYAYNNPINLVDPYGQTPAHAAAILAAIRAAWVGIKIAIKKCAGNPVCRCQAIYASYKYGSCIFGCSGGPQTPKAVLCALRTAQAAALGACVTMRSWYIRSGCDRVIPTKKDHPKALAEAIRAMVNCSESAACACAAASAGH